MATSVFRVLDIPVFLDGPKQEEVINGAIMAMEDDYFPEGLSVSVRGFQAIPLTDYLTVILHIEIDDKEGESDESS
jgi:hypothetical protein